MSNQWLKARQTKYAGYVTVYILVIVTIGIVANILADRYNKSYDSTANRRYSFSEQTEKVVGGLSQDVKILYFGRKPFGDAKALLGRYTDISRKIRIEYIDMETSPQIARANDVIRPDTSIVQIGERKQQARNLSEEEITGALIRALKDKVRTICYLTGSGEHSIDDTSGADGYGALKEPLEKEGYKTETISLLEKSEVPAECTVVVSGGPQTDYPPSEIAALKKFVEGGGRALFMLDAPLKLGRFHTSDNDGLASALQDWGVVVDKDFILDPYGERQGLGAYVAMAGGYGQHPIVQDMARIPTGYPYSRSLQVKKTGRATVQALSISSQAAVASTKFDSPEVNSNDSNLLHGPFILGATGTYETGRENIQGRFVVFGSSQWASNQFIAKPSLANIVLALNTIDWLASDEDLIAIRPKSPDDRPVTMNGGQMSGVLLVSLLLIPLAAIFAGITVWARRR